MRDLNDCYCWVCHGGLKYQSLKQFTELSDTSHGHRYNINYPVSLWHYRSVTRKTIASVTTFDKLITIYSQPNVLWHCQWIKASFWQVLMPFLRCPFSDFQHPYRCTSQRYSKYVIIFWPLQNNALSFTHAVLAWTCKSISIYTLSLISTYQPFFKI